MYVLYLHNRNNRRRNDRSLRNWHHNNKVDLRLYLLGTNRNCYQNPECAQRHSVRGNLTGQHLHCGTISQAASDMNNQWEFSRNHWKHIFLDLPMLILSSWWCAVTMHFYFLMSHVCFNSWWKLFFFFNYRRVFLNIFHTFITFS